MSLPGREPRPGCRGPGPGSRVAAVTSSPTVRAAVRDLAAAATGRPARSNDPSNRIAPTYPTTATGTHAGLSTAPRKDSDVFAYRWKCLGGPNNQNDHYGSEIANCDVGAELWSEVFFPACWDG